MSLAEPLSPAALFNEDPVRPHVSASLDRLLAALVDHLRERRGLVVLSGESGSGKSTALRQLAIDAAPGIAAVVVRATPQTKARDIFEALLRSLGEKPSDEEATGFRVRAALARAEIPYPALLVDDAEQLSPSGFAALVELAAPGDGYLSITVVLATSLARSALLKGPTMVAASSGAFTMPPLSRREVEYFVRSHLHRAQLPLDAFAAPALEEISRRSAGNPRAVARIAGAALERALRAGRASVILDDLRDTAGAEPKTAAALTAPPPAVPSVAEIEGALRAIRAAASDRSAAPPAVAPADPIRVVIAAAQGGSAAPPTSGISMTKTAPVPAVPPPMPRSIWAVAAGAALVSASAVGFLALTYSDGLRISVRRAIASREAMPSRAAPPEVILSGSSPPAASSAAPRRLARIDAPTATVLAAASAPAPAEPSAPAPSAVPEPPAPARGPTTVALAAAPEPPPVPPASDAAPAPTPPVDAPPANARETIPSEAVSAAPSAAPSPHIEVAAPIFGAGAETASSEASAAATMSGAPEAPVAPTEIALSETDTAAGTDLPPEPVDLDSLPPPVVADLGLPPQPVADGTGTGVASPADAPVTAAGETAPAADPVAALAPPVAPDTSDLTALFTEAEAAIQRETSRHASATPAASPDGISPELRRTFEAFLRSLEPAAKSPEADSATRAAFERFLAEQAQHDQRSAQRAR